MTGEDGATRVLAGRYRLVRKLGQGGMGIVWKARDEALGRDVAVKELLLPAHLDEDGRALAAMRAMREARAAALLRHRSIVTVHDVVMDDGRPCIVMDLLPGRSLDAVVGEDGPLAPDRAARIGLDVLTALRTAHEHGVLHRDVKPANVFLRDDGHAVLTDFGIASLEGDVTLTVQGALVGSPAYMAPERVRHDGDGPAGDLWSLGVTLYALTEGRAPFGRATLMGTLSAVLTEHPPPPRAAGALAPAIMALLAKDPAARLNASGAEPMLRAAAAGEPSPALPPPPLPSPAGPGPATVPPQGPRNAGPTVPAVPARRRRWPWAAVPAVAVTGTVLAVLLPWSGADGDRPRTGGRSPQASSPAPTPTARFASAPSPCGLITVERVAQIVPGATQQRSDPSTPGPGLSAKGCTWVGESAAPGAADEDTLSIDLVANLPAPKTIPSTLAHDRFATERDSEMPRGATPDPAHPFRDLQGLADEAFAHERTDTDPDATVFFRLNNLTAEVRFRTEKTVPIKRQQDGARKAAQWLLTELNRS